MQPELAAFATQFGMAGLIAWMWLTERRAVSQREQQLSSTHERLMEQRIQLDALMRLIADNTRAVAALEAGQRALSSLVERLAPSHTAPPAPPTPSPEHPAPLNQSAPITAR